MVFYDYEMLNLAYLVDVSRHDCGNMMDDLFYLSFICTDD